MVSVCQLHLAIPAAGLHPSTLYLQFNNCSQENKNKYMLAYCHWLVFNKVFQSITISFLPEGHTHKDNNQMFSTFHSSASPWMGPYSFLNLCPSDSPLPLLPAQLNTTILKDTLSARS
jgi:hypothetical protein